VKVCNDEVVKSLTPRQLEVLQFIQSHRSEQGYSPSYRDIQTHFGYASLGSVFALVKALKVKGHLENESAGSRTLQPLATPSTPHELEVPFVGYIKGGALIELFQQAKTMRVPSSLVHRPENTYVLQIQGDGFIEDHFLGGDLLIIEARTEALRGETVLTLINQHDTLIKRYALEGPYIRLEGRHHQHPLLVQQDDLLIQGVVIALIRHF